MVPRELFHDHPSEDRGEYENEKRQKAFPFCQALMDFAPNDDEDAEDYQEEARDICCDGDYRPNLCGLLI